MKAIKSQDIGNKRVIAMDMILSRASVPSLGREATPELERRPFDQDLRARLETMEIDPPDATTRFQHRLKQYYKWTDEFATRTLDGRASASGRLQICALTLCQVVRSPRSRSGLRPDPG